MITDADFDNLKFNLSYTVRKKEDYQKELLSLDERNYGYWLVRIATECTLLLDQFMEVVWTKVRDLNKNKKKPHTFFPVYENIDDFNNHIERIGVSKIKDDYEDLYKIIKDLQPFNDGQLWLHRQNRIASERHSNPQMVYEYKLKRGIYFHHIEEGTEVELRVSVGGFTTVSKVRRWGIPDREPPKFIIKSKDEAVNFIEECISGTNKLIRDMIECFEKRL